MGFCMYTVARRYAMKQMYRDLKKLLTVILVGMMLFTTIRVNPTIITAEETEDEIRDMGRTASGVKGVDLEDDAIVVGAEVVSNDDNILLVTENGYGKQTKVADFRQTRRGSKGVKALNITDKNGKIADFKVIGDANDVIIVTNSGMIMRMPISQISVLGRITQGVRLINLKDGQKVSTITLIKSTEQNEEESTFSDNNIEPSLDNVQV